MNKQDSLVLAQTDFDNLLSLAGSTQTETAELLEEELNRATIVPDQHLPSDVVSMNTQVTFQDLDTQAVTQVTLVFPADANIEENKISVLAPVGAALIGLKVGQVIHWPLPTGKQRSLKVTHVTRSPMSIEG